MENISTITTQTNKPKMNCLNCNCGTSGFSMYFNKNTGKHESKYGNACSFTCSVAIHDKDIKDHPENYEWVCQKTESGGTLSFYVKK